MKVIIQIIVKVIHRRSSTKCYKNLCELFNSKKKIPNLLNTLLHLDIAKCRYYLQSIV